jgi:hypothetical protein
MLKRKDYMEQRCTHSEYYGEIAQRLYDEGLLHLPSSCSGEKVVDALEQGDIHLNTIPLSIWDGAAIPFLRRAATHNVFLERGDWVSLGNFVCALKEFARMRARQLIDDETRWKAIHDQYEERLDKALKRRLELKRLDNC